MNKTVYAAWTSTDNKSIFDDGMVQKCGPLFYTVNLVVLEHLYFFFQATPDALLAGCDSILVHSAGTTSDDGMSKEAYAVPNGLSEE